MSSVKFSIVGCGRIGIRHAEHIVQQGILNSACDCDEKALENFSKKFPGIKLFDSIENLLLDDTESEVINICTPNGLHKEHSIMALRAGKHVVCEKPMALNVEDCEEMVEESKKNRRDLFVVKQNRYNPPVVKLKEILDKGLLGKIYSAQLNCFWNRTARYYQESNWKGSRDLDGGILFTQFSHFVDLLIWFIGEIKNVSAFETRNFEDIIEIEDTLVAIAEFHSGVIATLNFTINSYEKNMEGSITLFGENGTIKVGGQCLNVLEYQNIKNYKIENMQTDRSTNDYGFYQGSMSNHDKVIENVIEVLTKGKKIAVDGNEGIKTIMAIQKIYDAVLTNKQNVTI